MTCDPHLNIPAKTSLKQVVDLFYEVSSGGSKLVVC